MDLIALPQLDSDTTETKSFLRCHLFLSEMKLANVPGNRDMGSAIGAILTSIEVGFSFPILAPTLHKFYNPTQGHYSPVKSVTDYPVVINDFQTPITVCSPLEVSFLF